MSALTVEEILGRGIDAASNVGKTTVKDFNNYTEYPQLKRLG